MGARPCLILFVCAICLKFLRTVFHCFPSQLLAKRRPNCDKDLQAQICNHLDWYAKLARRAEYSCDVFGTADRHGVIASFELFGFTEAQCKGTVPSGLSLILHDFGVTMCDLNLAIFLKFTWHILASWSKSGLDNSWIMSRLYRSWMASLDHFTWLPFQGRDSLSRRVPIFTANLPETCVC